MKSETSVTYEIKHSFYFYQIEVWITGEQFNATTQILLRRPNNRLHVIIAWYDCFQIASLGGSFIWLTQTIFAPWTLPGERFSVHGYRTKNSDRKNRNTKRRRRRIKNRENSWIWTKKYILNFSCLFLFVVYFNQLLGAARTQKLVKVLF